jgi:Flp pilus assembly pilin Flp
LKSKILISRFIADDSAQATVEYVLLLSLAVAIASAFLRAIGTALDRGILRFGGVLERRLKSGRAPLYVWEN